MAKTYAGKVVVVTGANAGIGESAVNAFAEAGATVYGIARRKDALEAAKAKHPHVKWLLADVSKSAEIQRAIETVVKEAGRLDVLVNNAAVFTFAPLEASDEQAIRTQFETNVLGASFAAKAAKAALPALKASKGTILNISSAAGHTAAAGGSHYGATKAALESFTRSWALELAPVGIRVNAIAPGPTDTQGFQNMGPTPEIQAGMKAAFVGKVPLGRMAAPEEMSRWIVALADPSVTFITGQVLSVDGGMSLT